MAEEKVYNEGTTDETVVTKEDSKVKSFFKRKIDWVKNHPVKTALVAGGTIASAAGAALLARTVTQREALEGGEDFEYTVEDAVEDGTITEA